MISKNTPAFRALGYASMRRTCRVKRREQQQRADARRASQRAASTDAWRERNREKYLTDQRAASKRLRARRRAEREAFTRKLGKLLNLSVHGATEHERVLARQKYNQLKARKQVA
jgi:hypothetical protein